MQRIIGYMLVNVELVQFMHQVFTGVIIGTKGLTLVHLIANAITQLCFYMHILPLLYLRHS